jgi:hypothetical protein
LPDAQPSKSLREVWRQTALPVVFRRARPERLLVKVPFAPGNMEWLRDDQRSKPEWNSQYKGWELPQAWFERTTRLCLRRYKSCYVVQLLREQQVCAPACWNAEGIHCECSCMGENHGAGHPGGRWYEVSETLAVSSGVQKYACRLIRSPSAALYLPPDRS